MVELTNDERAILKGKIESDGLVATAKVVGVAPNTLKSVVDTGECRSATAEKVRAYFFNMSTVCDVATATDVVPTVAKPTFEEDDEEEEAPDTQRQETSTEEAEFTVPFRQLMSSMTDSQVKAVVRYGQSLLSGRG